MLSSVLNLGSTIIDKLFPDKNEAEKAKLRLLELQQKGELDTMQTLLAQDLAQLKVNEVEAAHSSIFVAGWRPAVGWICVIALGWSFLVQPTLNWLLLVFDVEKLQSLPLLPKPEIGELLLLLANMLGFGALRTWEKIKGVDKS